MRASEHFVPKLHVLETRKMGKRKDLSDFDRGQIVMTTGSEHLQNWGVPSLQRSVVLKVVQGRKSSELATGSCVAKAH